MPNGSSSHRTYEFRCPVHGFIEVNDWEREVIDHPVFQRLRRIRQLGWTDYVYPGGMHTRFEHSLGVMHVLTRMYDAISDRSGAVLQSRLDYDPTAVGRFRDLQLMRFSALLHDVGHAPFSHAAEALFPYRPNTQERYGHEDCSAAIIRHELKEVIETHPANDNMRLTVEEIASLIDGTTGNPHAIFWRELIDGQMDADRMDYLLRDSLHLGVQYGRFDLDRIVATSVALEMTPEESDVPECRLGVTKGGLHAAVGLILARYFMFTQVYFHKTRVAYDIHLRNALSHMIPEGFPPPEHDSIGSYLEWDDWRVLGLLSEDKGGEHGRRLRERNHFRQIWETSESPLDDEQMSLDALLSKLGDLAVEMESSDRSWYKTGSPDIQVATENTGEVRPLSDYSSVIKQLIKTPHRQVRLYSLPEMTVRAEQVIRDVARSNP